jgi:hypothetical protein
MSYHIVYCKIYKHFIKFIKNYRYTYVNGILIINLEHIQIITNLIITYAMIFNKTNLIIQIKYIHNIQIQIDQT